MTTTTTTSPTTTTLNTAPVASEVNVSGTLKIGQILTGDYTYMDAESDSEGASTYQWYRADDASGTNSVAISSATVKTYTLQSVDLLKYVRFEVIPAASSGVSPGSAAQSGWSGAVACASVTNVATGGIATQTTDYSVDTPATKAIDNNTNGDWAVSSIASTHYGDMFPWWMVTLAQAYPIESITLWNRTDCCGARLHDITIKILDSIGNVAYTSAVINPVNPSYTLTLPTFIVGKSVRISKNTTGDLSGSNDETIALAEVQVFACQ